MNERKLIAEALLEIARNSITEFIEVGQDYDLIESAEKFNIKLPSPDLAVIKTVYAEIDKVNHNGVILPRNAVEKGLATIIGKQINWEHKGSGFICGYIIDTKIIKNEIEITGVIFKSLFPEEMTKVKEKFKNKELCVSFEIWNKDENGNSVLHDTVEGFKSVNPIIFHGCGLLLNHKPACPKAKVYKLIANKEIENAEKIIEKVFEEDLIFAELAIEEIEEASYECECLKCGKVITSEKHCKDIKCPECGGEMRRKDRPGKGQPIEQSENKEKEETKPIMLKELFVNITEEKEITFDTAMVFYYSSDEEKATLTEDAAKWTRKFINNLPDSAFAVIEPAYPEKIQDKNCRHLPHHNGEGDLGKDKLDVNLDLSHYKNALARVNQINPISDSISAEDLRGEASNHLERHKDVLEKASLETKTEEIKISEKSEETKSVNTDAETKSEEIKVEETKELTAQEVKIEEPKKIVKVTRIYSEVTVDTFIDGTLSGTSEVRGYNKRITEYNDGTKDEVEEEVKIEKKYSFSELEEAIKKTKEEKDIEISTLKTDNEKIVTEKDKEISNLTKELESKTQEIERAKAEDNKTDDLTVGEVEVKERNKEIQKDIDKRAFGERK